MNWTSISWASKCPILGKCFNIKLQNVIFTYHIWFIFPYLSNEEETLNTYTTSLVNNPSSLRKLTQEFTLPNTCSIITCARVEHEARNLCLRVVA